MHAQTDSCVAFPGRRFMGPRRRAIGQQGLTPQFPVLGAPTSANEQQPHAHAASMLSAASVEPQGAYITAQHGGMVPGMQNGPALSAIQSQGDAEHAAMPAPNDGTALHGEEQSMMGGNLPLQGDMVHMDDDNGGYYPPGIDPDDADGWIGEGQGQAGANAEGQAAMDTAAQAAWPVDGIEGVAVVDAGMGGMEGGALGAPTPYRTRQARAQQAAVQAAAAEPFDPYKPLDPHDRGTLAVKPMQVSKAYPQKPM